MSNMTLFQGLATSAGLSQEAYLSTIKATVFPQKGANATNEQLAAFLMVAKQYNLNPLTKEIFAFPANGGIQPVVSIDGWMKLINSHPEFDGMTFEDKMDDTGNIIAVTCRIHRKDRAHPIEATEYLVECKRETDVWKKWPRRMLRHKAAIQASRYAFGFAGIVDPDEAERIGEASYAELVDESETVSEWSAKISKCLSSSELSEVGKAMASVGMSKDSKAQLRAIYSAKFAELQEPAFQTDEQGAAA